MCGIIGYTGTRNAAEVLLHGLDALAYRGYDSAGIAVCEEGGIRRLRAAGKMENLRARARGEAAFTGLSGVGHTRWATHGAPTEENAHPHTDAMCTVAVVHNGILENERELREELCRAGVRFASDTDTEVIPHLLAHHLRQCGEEREAIRRTLARLRGTYALAMVFRDRPDTIYAVRRASPLAVAHHAGESFLASDVTALLPYTREVAYPEEGEIVCMTPEGITLGRAGEMHAPRMQAVAWEAEDASRAGYRHYMEKEIHEVPAALERTVREEICLPRALLVDTREVLFLGCGSAYHAALLGRVWGEEVGIRARVEIASEFRYRRAPLDADIPAIAVSQSGETADTLAALTAAKARGCTTIAIVNVPSSAIARAADHVIYTKAGPEIAVATTKAYCAQVAAIWSLFRAMQAARGKTPEPLSDIPSLFREILETRQEIKALASRLVNRRDSFFIGRGADAAACREGALKLKEITYLHAEAFDAGELKHGTISLIEKGTPVVALMTQPHVMPQMQSNIREVQARGAEVLVIAAHDADVPPGCAVYRLSASVPPEVSPLAAAFVMQQISYEVAVEMGLDVDMPRNLAKSVTVE